MWVLDLMELYTRLGEALSIFLRFINEDFEIKQCLVRLQLLAKASLGKKANCFSLCSLWY